MDHHLLPDGVTHVGFRVPLVCASSTQDPYDGGDFLTYPARRGKSWLAVGDEEIDDTARLKHRFFDGSCKEQETMYQAWLFFGLLHNFLGASYNYKHYISESLDGEYWVETAQFVKELTEAMILRARTSSNEEIVAQCRRESKCMRLVFSILSGCHQNFDWRVKLSIVSISEVFSCAIKMIYLDKIKENMPFMIPTIFFVPFPPKDIRTSMLEAGWCVSEVSSMSQKFGSLNTHIFLSKLKKMKKDHSKCTEDTCMSYQIDENAYQAIHRPDCRGCLPSNNCDAQIAAILESGSLPVLRVGGTPEQVMLEAVAATKDTEYVALSHVWADGLGNPNACQLPSCQLHYVGQIAGQLPAQNTEETSSNSGKGLHLWIDTICCPVAPANLKSYAITQMHATYSRASHVLVLDAGLATSTYDAEKLLEALLRILVSGWMQRLWTLQEGVLPRHLWIQFANDHVEFDTLVENLVKIRHTDARLLNVVEDVWRYWAGIRRSNYLGTGLSGDQSIGSQLDSLDSAIILRSVSVPSDEPLCISTLLKLDTSIFQDLPTSPEIRMCRLWRLLSDQHGGLPRDMIALNYPRLSTIGFRWAPKTLLVAGPVMRSNHWLCPKVGKITDEGFIVRYPGFILTLQPRVSHVPVTELIHNASIASNRLVFDHGSTRYMIMASSEQQYPLARQTEQSDKIDDLVGKRFAVIYNQATGLSGSELSFEAFLCAIDAEGTPTTPPKVHIVRRLVLMRGKYGHLGLLYEHIDVMIEEVLPILKDLRPEEESSDATQVKDTEHDEALRDPSNRLFTKRIVSTLDKNPDLAEELRVSFGLGEREMQIKLLLYLSQVRMRYQGRAEIPKCDKHPMFNDRPASNDESPAQEEYEEVFWCIT